MFRIASVVLLAASLSAAATAQAADQVAKKDPAKQAPANGTVSNTQSADGTVSEPDFNGEEPAAPGTVYLAPSDFGPPPKGTATLKMTVNGPMVQAYVHSSLPGFIGVVGLSLTQDLIYPFGLSPLLADSVVMAFGGTDTQDLALGAALSTLPAESITLFGQALVIDELGVWTSNVVGLKIGGKDDGSVPASGSQVNADAAAAAAIN
jgi:hypothetical protein